MNLKSKVLHFFTNILYTLSESKHFIFRKVLFSCLVFLIEKTTHCKVYRIVDADTYAKSHSSPVVCLKTDRVGYAANAVRVGIDEQQILKEIPLPDLNLYTFSDVHIHRCSDLIVNVKEKTIINDYCAHNDDKNKPYNDSVTRCQRGKIALLCLPRNVRYLECGIMINGQYSFNYYHDLYENLIKIMAVLEYNEKIPSTVPFIVDEDIINIPSLKRICEILTKDINRQVIPIRKNESIHVNCLYGLSDINYIVPAHVDYTKGEIEDFVFEKYYTLKLRNYLLSNKSTKEFPKRFFITRKGSSHRQINEDELFAVLEPLGFKMVAPEQLSFEDQMRLFNDAEWIVGCTGAAFTNLLFCSSKCHVICFVRHGYIPPCFTAPVCFNKATMVNFQAAPKKTTPKAHSDFRIDTQNFADFMNSYFGINN